MNLSRYKTSDLQKIKEDANLTEDEEMIYYMLSKGKSIIQIADKMNLSTRTIDRRIRDMKEKLNMWRKVVGNLSVIGYFFMPKFKHKEMILCFQMKS